MTQTALHHSSPTNVEIAFFQPQSKDEEITARVARLMLEYHILRVQLEGAKPDLTDTERQDLKQKAIQIRRQGFREENKGRQERLRVAYDDEMLRIAGTRIAYVIARGDAASARKYTEQVIEITVRNPGIQVDKSDMSIAA
jgi:hypothetical protein